MYSSVFALLKLKWDEGDQSSSDVEGVSDQTCGEVHRLMFWFLVLGVLDVGVCGEPLQHFA